MKMGYIEDIRTKLGHDTLILVGVNVLIHKDGQILLQQRMDNGRWGIHGGCKELGETTEQTARRKLYEETGLTAHSLTLMGVYSGANMRHTYPNGDNVEVVAVVYLCDDFSGELRPQQEEVRALRWFPVDALPENITPVDARAIADFVTTMHNGQ